MGAASKPPRIAKKFSPRKTRPEKSFCQMGKLVEGKVVLNIFFASRILIRITVNRIEIDKSRGEEAAETMTSFVEVKNMSIAL